MSNRFHNKLHRQNHHSARTPFNENYIDAAFDPIASYDAPFEGEFFSRGEIVTCTYLSAHDYVYAMDGRVYNNFFVENDLEVDRNSLFRGYVEVEKDLKIHGNLTVLGHISEFETKVTISSATEITNYGTGPALKITQYGTEPIAHFIDINGDDIIFQDNGYMGLGTDSPNEKLTVVGSISSTNHLIIDQTAFVKQNLTVGSNVLFVDYLNQKVGINTQNPNEELTIVGSISSTESLRVDKNASVSLNASFGTFADSNVFTFLGKISSTSNTTTPAVEIAQSGSGARLVVSGNNDRQFVVANNGNVGIGTLAPNKEFTVVGSISSTEGIYSSTIQAGSFASNSIAADQITCATLTSTNSISARNTIRTNSAIVENVTAGIANVTNVVNISSVTFTGQTTQAVSVSADNTFLKILINGQPKYIRLFDIA